MASDLGQPELIYSLIETVECWLLAVPNYETVHYLIAHTYEARTCFENLIWDWDFIWDC